MAKHADNSVVSRAMRRLPAALLAASISLGILVAPSVEEGIAAAGVAAHPHAVTTQTPVKGIAVTLGFANRLTDAKAMSMANTLMSFIANTLHANAVSLNFPFWQRGSLSSDPMRQPMTSSTGLCSGCHKETEALSGMCTARQR